MSTAPLKWLQAFEAAGRSGSFKAAAEELGVSPSNVSHQIRQLEHYLGTPLFRRSGRQVTLTVEGANLLPALTAGFYSIREASTQARSDKSVLRVGAFPFLANEIISPKLIALRQAVPHCDFQIFTHTQLESLTHVDPEERLDLVVCYGSSAKRFNALCADALSRVAVVPVVAADYPTIADPAALLDHPLIRVIGPFQGWERWQASYCSNKALPQFRLETDSFHAAMLAVARGDGVCLGVQPYVQTWINEGRVRALEDWVLPVEDQALFAVYPPHLKGNAKVDAFVRWLRDVLKVNPTHLS